MKLPAYANLLTAAMQPCSGRLTGRRDKSKEAAEAWVRVDVERGTDGSSGELRQPDNCNPVLHRVLSVYATKTPKRRSKQSPIFGCLIHRVRDSRSKRKQMQLADK
jgi:hypothetical protein